MAFSAHTQTFIGDPPTIKTALVALAVANAIIGITFTPLGEFVWNVVVAYDSTAPIPGQTIKFYKDAPAAFQAAINADAATATTGIQALEIVALGDNLLTGIMIFV